MSFCCHTSGNKIDRLNAREVPTQIGKEWAERHEMRFMETSAKEADNVDKLFIDIAEELTREAVEKSRLEPDNSGFNLSNNTKSISRCSQCFTKI